MKFLGLIIFKNFIKYLGFRIEAEVEKRIKF